jgi:hypothetical protein
MLDRRDVVSRGRKIADNRAVDRYGRRSGCSGEPDARHRHTDNQYLSHREISLNHCLSSTTIAHKAFLLMHDVSRAVPP